MGAVRISVDVHGDGQVRRGRIGTINAKTDHRNAINGEPVLSERRGDIAMCLG
jgi:hypothetical protein